MFAGNWRRTQEDASIASAIFSQIKQQVSTNHNLADVCKKLDNLSGKLSKPPNPQTPVSTVLTKLNHNVGDLRAEAQVFARQRIESNRTLAQQNALTNQLRASVNGLRQEIGGLTGMMGTFLLVLTQQGSIG